MLSKLRTSSSAHSDENPNLHIEMANKAVSLIDRTKPPIVDMNPLIVDRKQLKVDKNSLIVEIEPEPPIDMSIRQFRS